MNIYDISEQSGYSIATVSRVINGKGNVSAKATAKITAVIKELGYVPNALARGLGTGSVQTVGLLCLDVADMYLAGAVSILERELRAKGYHSLLNCTGPNPEDKKTAVQLLLAQPVDALVLIGSHFMLEDNSYILNAAKKVPVIFLNGHLEGENIYCVTVDDYAIVKHSTQLLLAAGHQDFLYLYDKKTVSGQHKLQGFRDALAENTLQGTELFLEKNLSQAKEAIAALLAEGQPVDAVLASEDLLATAALKALLDAGISVPQQAEIIGYNNSLLAQCSIPELTSIDSKMEALCMLATSALFGVLEGKDFPNRTVLSASLVKRQTTTF